MSAEKVNNFLDYRNAIRSHGFSVSPCVMRSDSVATKSAPYHPLELDAESIDFLSALPSDQKSKTLHVVGANVESEQLTERLRGCADFWQRYGICLKFVNCNLKANVERVSTLNDMEQFLAESFNFRAVHSPNNHLLLFLKTFKHPRVLGLTLKCRRTGKPHVAIFESRLCPREISDILNHELGHLIGLKHNPSANHLMNRRYCSA